MTLTDDQKTELRKAEPSYLQDLIAAADQADVLDPLETAPIIIPALRGRPEIPFTVTAVSLTRSGQLMDANRTKKPNPDLGGALVAGDVNFETYWADLILEATVPDSDGVKLWNRAELLSAYGCRTSKELILKLIPVTGWLGDISNRIDALSGRAGLPTPEQWAERQRERTAQALGN